jgi:catalase
MSDKTTFEIDRGNGGETHQHVPTADSHAHDDTAHLTTNQGIRA